MNIINSESTTREKFESVRAMVAGIDNKIDKQLDKISKILKKIEQVKKRKIIELTAENLPEKSEKQKKRKKAVVLLMLRWKKLKSEVARVQTEFENSQKANQTTADKVTSGGKIAAFAKGPLGIITIIAATVAVSAIYVNSKTVDIVIKNAGCQTIQPVTTQSISIPGLELPNYPIPDGGQAVVTVPSLTLTIDGTNNPISVSAYGTNFSFQLPRRGVDILFNSKSLIGATTQIKLSSQKTHEVVISCS